MRADFRLRSRVEPFEPLLLRLFQPFRQEIREIVTLHLILGELRDEGLGDVVRVRLETRKGADPLRATRLLHLGVLVLPLLVEQ